LGAEVLPTIRLSNEILEATRGWLSAGDGEGAKVADVA
jgi:TetR/AcrR family transcriptional repressor of nem operon